jgi:hypothetical protein
LHAPANCDFDIVIAEAVLGPAAKNALPPTAPFTPAAPLAAATPPRATGRPTAETERLAIDMVSDAIFVMVRIIVAG